MQENGFQNEVVVVVLNLISKENMALWLKDL
jgi:hypothetical protein